MTPSRRSTDHRRVGHIKVESPTRVAFDLGTNQLGVRHFSRFLRSGPRCCRHMARFRFSAGHFSKARSGAPGWDEGGLYRFPLLLMNTALETVPSRPHTSPSV